MTKDEIRDCVRQHADAAQRAIRAGFDGTEVTSFMGYLLANFNSRFTNQRTDEYGGSIENRGRFMRELIDGIKQATPDNPLVVRLNGAELMDRWGGNTEDECFELMQQAVDCRRRHDQRDRRLAGGARIVDRPRHPARLLELPVRARQEDVPGHADHVRQPPARPGMADECLRDGVFDYWEVCRPLLADPELIHKAAEDRLDEVRRCIGSLNCLSRLFRDLPYTCTMNPALGHEVEPEYQVTPAAVKKKVMVIGAGPAGMECAITAAKRGHDVTVFDKADRIGGNLVCLRDQRSRAPRRPAVGDLATTRSMAQEARHRGAVQHRSAREIHAQRAAPVRRLRDRRRRDARPQRATRTSRAPSGCSMGWTSRTAACKTGRRVVIVGGGKLGLTLAESLRKHQGAEVTVVEPDKRIAGDVMPSFKWRHASWVEELGITCLTSSSLIEVTADGVKVRNAKGEETFVAADTVIQADGAAPAHPTVSRIRVDDRRAAWRRRRADSARTRAGDPGRLSPGSAPVTPIIAEAASRAPVGA